MFKDSLRKQEYWGWDVLQCFTEQEACLSLCYMTYFYKLYLFNHLWNDGCWKFLLGKNWMLCDRSCYKAPYIFSSEQNWTIVTSHVLHNQIYSDIVSLCVSIPINLTGPMAFLHIWNSSRHQSLLSPHGMTVMAFLPFAWQYFWDHSKALSWRLSKMNLRPEHYIWGLVFFRVIEVQVAFFDAAVESVKRFLRFFQSSVVIVIIAWWFLL